MNGSCSACSVAIDPSKSKATNHSETQNWERWEKGERRDKQEHPHLPILALSI